MMNRPEDPQEVEVDEEKTGEVVVETEKKVESVRRTQRSILATFVESIGDQERGLDVEKLYKDKLNELIQRYGTDKLPRNIDEWLKKNDENQDEISEIVKEWKTRERVVWFGRKFLLQTRWKLNKIKGFDYVLVSQSVAANRYLSENYFSLMQVMDMLEAQSLIDLLKGLDCSLIGRRLYQLGWDKPILSLFEVRKQRKHFEWRDTYDIVNYLIFLNNLEEDDFQNLVGTLRRYVFLWQDIRTPRGIKEILIEMNKVRTDSKRLDQLEKRLQAFVLTGYLCSSNISCNEKKLVQQIKIGEVLVKERGFVEGESNREIVDFLQKNNILEQFSNLLDHGWHVPTYFFYEPQDVRKSVKDEVFKAVEIQSLLEKEDDYKLLIQLIESFGIEKIIDAKTLKLMESIWQNLDEIKDEVDVLLQFLDDMGFKDVAQKRKIIEQITLVSVEYGIIFNYADLLSILSREGGDKGIFREFEKYWKKHSIFPEGDNLWLEDIWVRGIWNERVITPSVTGELVLRFLLPFVGKGIQINNEGKLVLSKDMVILLQSKINKALVTNSVFRTLDESFRHKVVQNYASWVLIDVNISELQEFLNIIKRGDVSFSGFFADFLMRHPEGWELVFDVKNKADTLLEVLREEGAVDFLYSYFSQFKPYLKNGELIFWSIWKQLYAAGGVYGGSTLVKFLLLRKDSLREGVIIKEGKYLWKWEFVIDYLKYLQDSSLESEFDNLIFNYLSVSEKEERTLAEMGRYVDKQEGYKICKFWSTLVDLLKKQDGKALMTFLIEHKMIGLQGRLIEKYKKFRLDINFDQEDDLFFRNWDRIEPEELRHVLSQLWLNGKVEQAREEMKRYFVIEKYVKEVGSVELMVLKDYLLVMLPQLEMELKDIQGLLRKLDELFEVAIIPSFIRNLILFRFMYLTPHLEYKETVFKRILDEAVTQGAVVSNDLKELSSSDEVFNLVRKDLVSILIRSGDLEYEVFLKNLEGMRQLLVSFTSFSDLSSDKLKQLSSFLEIVVGIINGFYVSDFRSFIRLGNNVEDNIKMLMNYLHLGNKEDLVAWVVKNITIDFQKPTQVLEEMQRYVDQANRRNIEKVGEMQDPRELIRNSIVKGVEFANISSILRHGLVCREYIGGEKATSDLTPYDSDFSLVPQRSSFELSLNETEAIRYGDVLLVVEENDNFRRRYELINSGVKGEDHVGVRTGIPSSEISAFVLKSEWEYHPRLEVDMLKFLIANNGFYIPIYDIKGNLIFAPDEYQHWKVSKKFNDLEGIIDSATPKAILSWFIDNNPFLGEVFSMGTGVQEKYTLREHILMVLGQFDKYFRGRLNFSFISEKEVVLLLLIHDLGKPLSVAYYNTTLLQHQLTVDLAIPLMKEMKVPPEKILMISEIINQDVIGEIVKSGGDDLEVERGIKKLKVISESIGVSTDELLDFLLMFYICDAGSYTVDAGGRESLDRLFVFNPKKGQATLSPEAQKMVNKLRQRLKT